MWTPHQLPHDEARKAKRDADIDALDRELQTKALDMLEWMLTPEDADQIRSWFRFTGWDWVEKNYLDQTWALQVAVALASRIDETLLPKGSKWTDYHVQLMEIAVGLRPDFREEEDAEVEQDVPMTTVGPTV